LNNLYRICKKIATEQHEGQLRKYNGGPYIQHPIRVAEMLEHRLHIKNDILKSAAVLHDVLEDCPISPTELYLNILTASKSKATEQAITIVRLVIELTSPDKLYGIKPLFNRSQRKAMTRAHFLFGSSEAAMIKVCDRYDNLVDMRNSEADKAFLKKYAEESQDLLDALKSEIPDSYADLHILIHETYDLCDLMIRKN